MIIPASCRAMMARQVTQYPADFDLPAKLAESERALYCPWLPSAPTAILDLGGGLGRTSVALHEWYGSPNICYNVADGDLLSEGEFTGGWKPRQQEWCNDLLLTRKFLEANGLRASQIFVRDLMGPDDCFEHMLPVDLVISTLAVGFHWPIEPWLPRLEGVICEGTRLIFGVRRGKYGPGTRFDGFETLGFAESGWKEDFLALKPRASRQRVNRPAMIRVLVAKV